MDPDIERNKLITEKVILDLLYGDMDYFEEFVLASIESFSEFRENYNLSIENNDLNILREAGHKIKPAAVMMNLDRLLELYDLSKAQLEDVQTDQMEFITQEMNSYCDQILEDLHHMLNE